MPEHKIQKYHLLGESLDRLPNYGSVQTIRHSQNRMDFQQMQIKIKLTKYPTLAIKSVVLIEDWIDRTRSKQLKDSMISTLKHTNGYNFLRQVRGDGNCFIRAVAFEYLSQLRTCKFQQCFSHLKEVSLTTSSSEYIPKNFLEFYNHDFLSYCLKQNWQKQYQQQLNKHEDNFKLALASLIADNPYLDFIIVLYMRAVSLLALKRSKKNSQIQNFVVKSDEEKLKSFGALSEGLSQHLLSNFLGFSIRIFQVRDNQIQVYSYDNKDYQKRKDAFEISLILHNKHYDILERQAYISSQFSSPSLQKIESYYSNTQNQELIQGQCTNCEQSRKIYASNSLCKDCFVRYNQALKQFRKSKIRKLSGTQEKKQTKENPESSRKYIVAQKIKNEFSSQKLPTKQKRRKIFGCFG